MSTMFAPIPGVKVIGFGHKARHGKDTAVRAILAEYAGAMRFSFADDLYAVCRVLHGMTVKDAPLLQRVGLEMRENIDPDIWIKAVYAKMLDAPRPCLALITDVRFPNEMAFVKALGGTTVRVTRYDERGAVFVDPSRPANHPSEIALNDAVWDVELANRGIADLEAAAVALANSCVPVAA